MEVEEIYLVKFLSEYVIKKSKTMTYLDVILEISRGRQFY